MTCEGQRDFETKVALVGVPKCTGYTKEILCRVSHTGDAMRVMYSSVHVGVVHVLGACVKVQSTVGCAFHTAA